MIFHNLGLHQKLTQALTQKGYKKATSIQSQAIPKILARKDVLGGAQTGTGKTAAFALPILNIFHESGDKKKSPRALVLTPTRELAQQVAQSFKDYGQFLPQKIAAVYGGVKINPQKTALHQGVDILVATPGRLLDHIQQGNVSLKQIEIFVLDEADRMLDMGFIRDIERIMSNLPSKRQNLLFSATYSKEIKKLANRILKDPVYVEVTRKNTAAEKVEQLVYHVQKKEKKAALAKLIKDESWYQVLVFVRTKHGANRLTTQLSKQNIPTMAIHGDKSQNARTRALASFKRGDIQALIATDIAARGLDIAELSHVVNYDLPQVPSDYVHRIGRTGRAGRTGVAISLVSQEEKKLLNGIQKLLGTNIPAAG